MVVDALRAIAVDAHITAVDVLAIEQKVESRYSFYSSRFPFIREDFPCVRRGEARRRYFSEYIPFFLLVRMHDADSRPSPDALHLDSRGDEMTPSLAQTRFKFKAHMQICCTVPARIAPFARRTASLLGEETK